jgi:hypothetical protein
MYSEGWYLSFFNNNPTSSLNSIVNFSIKPASSTNSRAQSGSSRPDINWKWVCCRECCNGLRHFGSENNLRCHKNHHREMARKEQQEKKARKEEQRARDKMEEEEDQMWKGFRQIAEEYRRNPAPITLRFAMIRCFEHGCDGRGFLRIEEWRAHQHKRKSLSWDRTFLFTALLHSSDSVGFLFSISSLRKIFLWSFTTTPPLPYHSLYSRWTQATEPRQDPSPFRSSP